MKALPYLLAALLLYTPITGQSALTAQARLYSLSFRLFQGMDQYGDELVVNSTGYPGGADELYPWDIAAGSEITLPGTSTYGSSLVLYDSWLDMNFFGTLTVNLPLPTDDNNNHYPDFFEVSRAYSGTGYYGSYNAGLYGGNGSVTAQFTRSAGSRTGTCRLTLQGWGTFVHTFEIPEYTGSLTYTPGESTISGTLNLTQTGNPASTFQGTVRFLKSSSNPSNELTLQPGTLTSDWLSASSFTNHLFYRDANWPANYYGYVEFDDDATPWSFCPYAFWVLSITDNNDADHNGVPDFSDVPQVAPPARRPQLSLARAGTVLQLTIRGDVGHLHEVQEATSLTSPNWQTVSSVTLTSDPQTVTLSLPDSTTKFWRVQAQ